MTPAFMFATGVENSDPTIQGGRVRVDEMEKCGHYKNWRTDFDCVQELGICFLRYGIPIHRTFRAPHKYDWVFADLTFNDLRRRKMIPIASPIQHCGQPEDAALQDAGRLFVRRTRRRAIDHCSNRVVIAERTDRFRQQRDQ